nr:MAG: hypothetical protein 2 [Betanecrovirus sp.]
MENSENVRDGKRSREYSRDRQQEGGYKEISKAAVRKEGDVKQDMGPSVSMTVVGEKVEFTQHFHF